MACIFCGGGPASKEHVWPQWLLRRFPTMDLKMVRTGPKPVSFEQKSIEITCNCVCRPCNNGWMSQLEDQALNFLPTMIEGQPLTLDSGIQSTLAAWAMKTAMVFEQTLGLEESERYWRQEERAQFRIPPHVPPGDPGDATNIRIATTDGSRVFLVTGGAHEIWPLDDEGTKVPATRATLQVGKLAIHVESHRWREVTGRVLWRPGPGFGTFLWPERQPQLQWPLEQILNDAQLEAFASST